MNQGRTLYSTSETILQQCFVSLQQVFVICVMFFLFCCILATEGCAQFGYFGCRSLESPDHAAFYVSCAVFLLLSVIGAVTIGFGRDKK